MPNRKSTLTACIDTEFLEILEAMNRLEIRTTALVIRLLDRSSDIDSVEGELESVEEQNSNLSSRIRWWKATHRPHTKRDPGWKHFKTGYDCMHRLILFLYRLKVARYLRDKDTVDRLAIRENL